MNETFVTEFVDPPPSNIIEQPYGWAIIICAMVATVLAAYFFFDWLDKKYPRGR